MKIINFENKNMIPLKIKSIYCILIKKTASFVKKVSKINTLINALSLVR